MDMIRGGNAKHHHHFDGVAGEFHTRPLWRGLSIFGKSIMLRLSSSPVVGRQCRFSLVPKRSLETRVSRDSSFRHVCRNPASTDGNLSAKTECLILVFAQAASYRPWPGFWHPCQNDGVRSFPSSAWERGEEAPASSMWVI